MDQNQSSQLMLTIGFFAWNIFHSAPWRKHGLVSVRKWHSLYLQGQHDFLDKLRVQCESYSVVVTAVTQTTPWQVKQSPLVYILTTPRVYTARPRGAVQLGVAVFAEHHARPEGRQGRTDQLFPSVRERMIKNLPSVSSPFAVMLAERALADPFSCTSGTVPFCKNVYTSKMSSKVGYISADKLVLTGKNFGPRQTKYSDTHRFSV